MSNPAMFAGACWYPFPFVRDNGGQCRSLIPVHESLHQYLWVTGHYDYNSSPGFWWQDLPGRLFQFWMLEKLILFNQIKTLVKSMDWWYEQWKISRRSLARFFKHRPVPDSGRLSLIQWNVTSYSIIIYNFESAVTN